MGTPSSLAELALVLLTAGAASIALIAAPFALPWPHRVRWAQAMAYAQVATGVPSLCSLGECTILALAVHPSGARLTLAESGHRPAGVGTLVFPHPADDDLVLLEGWREAGTLLLLCDDGEGTVSLSGPGATVIGLRRPRTASQPSRSA